MAAYAVDRQGSPIHRGGAVEPTKNRHLAGNPLAGAVPLLLGDFFWRQVCATRRHLHPFWQQFLPLNRPENMATRSGAILHAGGF